MAISFIGQASAAATSVTTPTHAAGDLIIIFAYRTTTTAPSLPAGYTNIVNGSGNSNSYRVGYKIATSTTDSSGTWTNATGVNCVVYRGVGGISGIGDASGATKAANTNATIPARTLQDTSGNSWVVAFAGHKATSTQGTPAAGATTVRGTKVLTSANIGAFDTNGGVGSFSATTSSNTTSVTSSGISIELLAPGANAAAALTDNFDDASIDAAKWTTGTNGAGSSNVETTVLTQTPDASTADAEAYVVGLNFEPKYNLTGDGMFVNLVQALNADPGAFSIFRVIADDNNYLTFATNNGNLLAEYAVGGSTTNLVTTTYSSTTHAWLRMRESSGTIYWDYSADGSSWSNLTSLANPFAITRVYPKLNAYAYLVASPGTSVWDNFNTVPATGTTVTPGVVNLVLTTYAPTVTATANQVATPPVKALTLATFAPTATVSNNQVATPSVATLTLTTFAPAANIGVNVVPPVASLTLTTYAPTVAVSNNQLVTPAANPLTLTTFAPRLKLVVIPPVTALTLATFAPQLQAKIITPLSTLTLTTYAPAVAATNHQTVTPGVVALVTTKFAPVVTTSDYKTATPGVVALTLTTFAPVISIPLGQTVTPLPASLVLVTFAPTATGNHFGPVDPGGAGTLTPRTPTSPGGFGTQSDGSGNWIVSPAIPEDVLDPQASGAGSFTPQA